MTWLKTKLHNAWLRMKKWVLTILVALGLVTGVVVFADDVNLSWQNATQWTDGSPILPGDLAETVLNYEMFALGVDVASQPRAYVELVRVPVSIESYLHVNVADGIHCYVAYHVATNGRRSDYSNESCKTIDTRLPGSPAGLSAN